MIPSITEPYRAGAYYRLSKEDYRITKSKRGKSASIIQDESNSILNQRRLIASKVSTMPEITIVEEYEDDGYTGLDFERPGFQKMMQDLRDGKINCIIVKDLSRLGRDHIDMGIYIRNVFPYIGARFIAINDDYDSLSIKSQTDHVTVPFKNIMNDNYSRDISVKVRSCLDAKRIAGEFIGSFAVYGYRRDKTVSSGLLIDPYPAEVIRMIVALFLEGYTPIVIAKVLNRNGILSPLEYKISVGSNYKSAFKKKNKSEWTSVAIHRILKNKVYIGVLEQGKVMKTNYKVKKRIYKDDKDWISVKDAHEPIIPEEDFWIVQDLLSRDIRTAPGQDKVYPLAGILLCMDCKQNMVRKNETHKGHKYTYYICSTNKSDHSCSSHRINEEKLYNVILEILRFYIQTVLDSETVSDQIMNHNFYNKKMEMLHHTLNMTEQDLKKCKSFIIFLYEDMKDGILSRQEYLELKKLYEERESELKEQCNTINKKIIDCSLTEDDYSKRICKLKSFENIEELDRLMVITLIKNIYVGQKDEIQVEFRHQDEYEDLLGMTKVQ